MSRIKTSNVSNLVSNFLPFSVFLAEMNPGLIPVQTVHVLFISKLWKLINANKTENVGILWLYDICIFSIINYFSLFFLSVSSFHTKRSLSVRWVLPQVCCPDVTFDSHHWCEHLPTARPQTPVGRLHRVLQEETHRQRSAAAPFDLSYEKPEHLLTLRFRAAGSSNSTCSSSMSRPSSGGVAGLTPGSAIGGEGAGLPLAWPMLQ